VQAVIDELNASRRHPEGSRQQEPCRRSSSGGGKLPELEVSVSMPHLCIVTRTLLLRDEQEAQVSEAGAGAVKASTVSPAQPSSSSSQTWTHPSGARPLGTSMRGRREIRGLSSYTSPPPQLHQQQASTPSSQVGAVQLLAAITLPCTHWMQTIKYAWF
jgi:hypothetical protein